MCVYERERERARARERERERKRESERDKKKLNLQPLAYYAEFEHKGFLFLSLTPALLPSEGKQLKKD